MAQRYDLSLEQGSSCVIEITPLDTSGNPIDLTGCSVQSQIRMNYADIEAEVLATFSPTIDIPNGKFSLALSAAQTTAININKGKWDVKITDSGGNVYRVVEGAVIIHKEVTRV